MIKHMPSTMQDVLIAINRKKEKRKNVVHQTDMLNSKSHVIILVMANKKTNKTLSEKERALLRPSRVRNYNHHAAFTAPKISETCVY